MCAHSSIRTDKAAGADKRLWVGDEEPSAPEWRAVRGGGWLYVAGGRATWSAAARGRAAVHLLLLVATGMEGG